MIIKLRKICDKLLKQSTNDKDVKKYTLLSKLLSDDNCFLKITMEQAYTIFYDLKIDKKYYKILYNELIKIN